MLHHMYEANNYKNIPLCDRTYNQGRLQKSVIPCEAYIFIICQSIGCSPILIIGFGLNSVSSPIRVPKPPAKITAFITLFQCPRLGCHLFISSFRLLNSIVFRAEDFQGLYL